MNKLLATTALVAILVTPAFAQTDADRVTDDTATTAAPDVMDQTMSHNVLSLSGMEIGADSLIGHRVYTPQDGTPAPDTAEMRDGVNEASDTWDDIGKIGDVLIDESGSVNSVVIDAGGFLGIGERHVRVDLADVQIINDLDDEDGYFVVYTGSRAMLEEGDAYDAETVGHNGLTSLHPGEWMAGDSADATSTPAATAATDADTDNAVDQMQRPERETLTSVAPTAVTADELKGARVYGSVDGWIGDISDLVMDEDGQVSKIVVDVGGWLGMGVHPVALAFDEIDLRRQDDDGAVFAFVDYSQEELEAMPEWTK